MDFGTGRGWLHLGMWDTRVPKDDASTRGATGRVLGLWLLCLQPHQFRSCLSSEDQGLQASDTLAKDAFNLSPNLPCGTQSSP